MNTERSGRARILVAEVKPIPRANLARACRRIRSELYVAGSWREFSEMVHGLERLRLIPDLVLLGDGFAGHREGEQLIQARFPGVRVVNVCSRAA